MLQGIVFLRSCRRVYSQSSSLNIDLAFGSKTTWELVRALALLRLCVVVKSPQKVLPWIPSPVLRNTIYAQFVGGNSPKDIEQTANKLLQSRLRCIMAATMEEDVGHEGDNKVYDRNCERILESIDISAGGLSPMIQLKLSGLLPADLLLLLGEIYSNSTDKVELIRSLSMEMKSEGSIKNSGALSKLNDEQVTSLKSAVKRLKTIGQRALTKNVKVLVDAEHTYLNPGLDLLTLLAIYQFNKHQSVIWNTYQCYLKNGLSNTQEQFKIITNDLGCHFGAKVVRGAYMEHERVRAQKLKMQDPICETYEATSKTYNSVLDYLLQQIGQLGKKCQFMAATHNEESVKIAISKMEDMKLDKTDGGVSFGQIYGMCDQLSYPLANQGYAVYKSVPHGPLEEVLPYLARRAQENRSILELGGSRKDEQKLMRKELLRRIPVFKRLSALR